MKLQELVKETINDIKTQYLSKADAGRPWAVAWSAGKDSTTTLSLFIKALEDMTEEERKSRHTYVVMSDTKVENPMLETYMYDQIQKLKNYVEQKNLPVSVELVSRPVKDSYFVLTLGRGYFLPLNSGQGRWCTQRLKTQPQNDALKEIAPSIVLIGTRLSESIRREKSMRENSLEGKIGKHAMAGTNTFMAIADWTIDDVWEYLGNNDIGWSSTIPVRKLYREATGECAVANPQGVEEKLLLQQAEACGARFGCWLCPVVETDKSTEAMTDYHGWLEPLTHYREMQSWIYGSYKPPAIKGQPRKERSEQLRRQEAINEKIKLITKAGFNRRGTRMKDGQGTFTVEARQFLFRELIKTEKAVNDLRKKEGLEPMKLISDEEIELIKKFWEEDSTNAKHLITNALGIPIEELKPLLKGEISTEEVEEYKKQRLEKNRKKKEEKAEKDK